MSLSVYRDGPHHQEDRHEAGDRGDVRSHDRLRSARC